MNDAPGTISPRGLWGLIEYIAPAGPARPWSSSLAHLQTTLRSLGFDHPDETILMALEKAPEWNPGFPWAVAIDRKLATIQLEPI